MDSSIENQDYDNVGVVSRCSECINPISERFKTLLLERNLKQQNLADGISYDKANISRIVNGLYIPDLDMRLKIAKFFGVDSSLIWRTKDLDYIRKQLENQNKKRGNDGKKD